MNNVLEELYYGNYEMEFHRTEKYRQAAAAYEQLLEKIRKGFNQEFVTELENTEAKLHEEEAFSVFRNGFHLGALLMIDLLHEPPQQP